VEIRIATRIAIFLGLNVTKIVEKKDTSEFFIKYSKLVVDIFYQILNTKGSILPD